MALALFARGQALAAERGLILADTKYEFGTDANGRIVLADEIHTPDSSRYWFAQSYAARFEAGTLPESFDKDVVRNWVAARCDPYRDAVPAIPPEVVLQTAATYVSAFEPSRANAFPCRTRARRRSSASAATSRPISRRSESRLLMIVAEPHRHGPRAIVPNPAHACRIVLVGAGGGRL